MKKTIELQFTFETILFKVHVKSNQFCDYITFGAYLYEHVEHPDPGGHFHAWDCPGVCTCKMWHSRGKTKSTRQKRGRAGDTWTYPVSYVSANTR
jgi:hypothetical protein